MICLDSLPETKLNIILVEWKETNGFSARQGDDDIIQSKPGPYFMFYFVLLCYCLSMSTAFVCR